MKSNHLIIAAIIVVLGVGLFLFGRTDTHYVPQDAVFRIAAAIQEQKVAVLAVTEGRGGDARTYVADVRAVVDEFDRHRADLIHVDSTNPVEVPALQYLGLENARKPLVLVAAVDGSLIYRAEGQLDAGRLKNAIHDALTRVPLDQMNQP